MAAAIRINQLAANAVRYGDGLVEISFAPSDNDDVIIGITGTSSVEDAREQIKRAFAEFGAQVANYIEERG